MAIAKKLSFIERVASFLKNDDNAKILKFQKRSIQKLELTIKALEGELETLDYERQDAIESEESALIEINVQRLDSVGRMDSYISEYINTLKTKSCDIKNIDAKIKELEEKVSFAKALILKLS